MKIKKKILSILHAGWMSASLVELKREPLDVLRTGFVIDISEEWLLLQIFDRDFLKCDGYMAVRLADITSAEMTTDWVAQSPARLNSGPVLQPDILLVDLPGLLSSVDAHFPVLGIEQERIDPEILHIGRVEKLGKKTVTLREVGRYAEWHAENSRYRLKDITRVTFGTVYAEALLEFVRAKEETAASELDNPDLL